MSEIKLLSPDTNRTDLEIVWSWEQSAPDWYQVSQGGKQELAEFLREGAEQMLFGLYDDENIFALLRMVHTGDQHFVLHLHAEPKADLPALLEGFLKLKEYLFEKFSALTLVGWIPTKHRKIVRLYSDLGFKDTFVRHYKYVVRGRPLIWQQFILTR